MRKWIWTISWALLVLQGCATSAGLKTAAVSERNADNLSRLNLGMSDSQVLGIMRDPYKDESFQLSEDQYDVWFYVTQPTVLSQTRMVPFNLTPLIFRNKLLVGMGYGYYNWLKDRTLESHRSRLSPEQRKMREAMQNATSFNHLPEMLSMGSPKKPDKVSEEPPPPPPKSQPQKNPPPAKKDIDINEKDEQMLEDESDQNFDYW